MTSDKTPSEKTPPEKEGWEAPSWKKVSEFVLGVIQLQRSVEQLKKQNTQLQDEVTRLQRLCDEHSGQLKTILVLIESTVNDRAVRNAETAAMRVVQQLLALRDDYTDHQD